MQMTYRELKDEIAKIIPRSIEYELDLEAGNIAIITSEVSAFTGQNGLIGKISKRVKRKIVLRTPRIHDGHGRCEESHRGDSA